MSFIKNVARSVNTACNRKKKLEVSANEDTQLRRCLTTLDLTFIGVGSTLGSGIYVLTGQVAKDKAGPAVVLSFFIAGFASLLSGFCYAEFGARIPKAGSAYAYCYITIGEFCAFVIGWNILLEYIIGGASIASALSAYIDSLAGGAIKNETMKVVGTVDVPGFSSYLDVFGLLLVLLSTLVLSLGVENSARLNNLCVCVNILTVVLVTCVGLAYAKLENWDDFCPYGAEGVFQGASTCFYAFIGFDVIATVSEETRNPGKSVPFAMIATVVICFVAYFGVSAAITLMLPYFLLNENSAVSTTFKQRHIPYMSDIIGVGATLGLAGCTLASMVPLPRIMYAMSQDGLLMKFFSKVHETTQVPVISTIIAGLFIAFLTAILALSELVEMLSIGTLLAYTIVDVCVIVLRYERKDNENDEETSETESTPLLQITRRKRLTPNVVIFVIILACVGISVILAKYASNIGEKNIACITLLSFLFLVLILCCVYLSLQSTNTSELVFKVPFLPWLPTVAVLINIYLMMKLATLTWYRFAAWMALGLIVYFAYSMHHSAERVPVSPVTPRDRLSPVPNNLSKVVEGDLNEEDNFPRHIESPD